MGQRELATRVSDLGVPMRFNTVSRLENGSRSADVEELLALAVALGASPNRLLLGEQAGDESLPLTPNLSVSARQAWLWAAGEAPLPNDGIPVFGDSDFRQENRPHDPPDETSVREVEDHAEEIKRVHQAMIRAADEEGVPLRIVYAALRFESVLASVRRDLATDPDGEDRE